MIYDTRNVIIMIESGDWIGIFRTTFKKISFDAD